MHDSTAFGKGESEIATFGWQWVRLPSQDPGSVGREDDAEVTVVGVGAHYRRNVAAQEELLLHVVKVECLISKPRGIILVPMTILTKLESTAWVNTCE